MLSGKGFYIWQIPCCEAGDPEKLAEEAKKSGFSHVLIKIADGNYAYNIEKGTNRDLVPDVVAALKAQGIAVWGWHYVYGEYPEDEASIGIVRTVNTGVDGYVINAELEYKNRNAQALTYMKTLRRGMPSDIPLALSSFRFPKYHREFPWNEFLSRVDLNMPQVYWVDAHNSGDQLRECVRNFSENIYPQVPIFPTGSAYKDNAGWQPTFSEVVEFMDTVVDMGLPGCNFWEWGNTRKYVPELWEAIAAHDLSQNSVVEPQPVPVPTPETRPQPVDIVGMAKVTSTYGLNVRAEPKAPGALRWFTMSNNTIVEVLEIKENADGSIWLRIGQQQWSAMKWRNPSTGVLKTYMEWI